MPCNRKIYRAVLEDCRSYRAWRGFSAMIAAWFFVIEYRLHTGRITLLRHWAPIYSSTAHNIQTCNVFS